jgi:hypothetical protein
VGAFPRGVITLVFQFSIVVARGQAASGFASLPLFAVCFRS